MTPLPCEQCISLAICVSKREVICYMLWSYYTNSEYKLKALKVISEILPNMGVVRKPQT